MAKGWIFIKSEIFKFPSIWMAQVQSQLLFGVFETKIYFMKLKILFGSRQNLENTERWNIYGETFKQYYGFNRYRDSYFVVFLLDKYILWNCQNI